MAATAGAASAALKKIRESQVIVIVQALPEQQVRGASLQRFEAREHIRRYFVEKVRAIRQVSSDAAIWTSRAQSGQEVGSAVVLQAGEQVKTQPGRGHDLE